jgi:predicted enzyme related to lactoylglutathione lyase
MPNPFAHVELSTDDVKKAKKFYSSVFAWKLDDMPAMAYTTIDVGGGVGGGLQKKQVPEQPSAWLPYVKVDDVKATMAKVVKAGGQAMLDYHEIGEMGSIGIFTDPQGAALGLWAEKAPAGVQPPPAPAKKAAKKAAANAAAPAKAATLVNKAPTPAKAAAPAKKAPAPAKKAAKKAAPVVAAAPAKKAAKKAAAPAPAAPPASPKKAPAKKR